MKLETINNRLSLMSFYKLVCTGWALAGSVLYILLLILLSLAFGFSHEEFQINGETVSRSSFFMRLVLPAVLITPVFILLHAFIIGAFTTFGLWLYSKKQNIVVVSTE